MVISQYNKLVPEDRGGFVYAFHIS